MNVIDIASINFFFSRRTEVRQECKLHAVAYSSKYYPTLPSEFLFWLFCKEVSRPVTWRSVSRKWLSWPLFWFSMNEESLKTDRAATEHRDHVCEWHHFWYPIIIGGFGLARRAQHSTLERRTWRYNVELFTWQSLTLRYIVSHALLDILMKYQ